MAKKRNSKKKHQNKSKSSGQVRRTGYEKKERNNEKFWAYYKAQGLIPEGEWDAFVDALQEDLPVSFRVQGCHKDRDQLIHEMESRFFGKIGESTDTSVFVPQKLEWYPSAYQTPMSRTEVRSHPIIAQLHNFLVTEAELGNISRQEAVSMIPPLLLNPDKDHYVLDVCAAPGSKTMQLIEMMHEDEPNPSGMVVANDVDKSRCYLLIHQILKRMKSANTVVLCEDATRMPNMIGPDEKLLQFDRVLCDVICSGDGTVRKNLDIWDKWSPQDGIGLHKLQMSIARRGAEKLKEGGRLVYSTCSMNPIEDEAVIAQLIRESNGGLRLIDAHPLIPKLKALRGVSTWKVFNRDMKEYNAVGEVEEKLQRAIIESMFPPTEEEAKEMNLHYTMRIAPHLQNTGGFFVALFEKVKDTSFKRENPAAGPNWKSKKMFKDDPFTFLKENDERWGDIQKHYGVSEEFPYQNLFNRMLETESNCRQLFFANDAVKHFVKSNMKKLSIQNAGMRMFGRNENKVDQVRFRISQEGVKRILPYLSKQVVQISKKDMLLLLKYDDNLVPMEMLDGKVELREQMSGSVVVYVDKEDPVCCWIGHRTCAPYVSKEEKIHLLRMLGEDTEEIEMLLKNKRREKAIKDRGAAYEAMAAEKEGVEKNGDEAEKSESPSTENENEEPCAKKAKVEESEVDTVENKDTIEGTVQE